jgi:hypothetical protein
MMENFAMVPFLKTFLMGEQPNFLIGAILRYLATHTQGGT